MILQFPTKNRIRECFNCGEVRKLRDEMPVCEECPEPQTEDEMSFLGGKHLVKYAIRTGSGDNEYWSDMLGMFQRIYTEDQFRELQRIITLGRGRNLRLMK